MLRVSHNVNYVFWVIMMHHYRFISCNKGTIPVRDVDNVRSFSVPSVQSFHECELLLTNKQTKPLKTKSLNKKKKMKKGKQKLDHVAPTLRIFLQLTILLSITVEICNG